MKNTIILTALLSILFFSCKKGTVSCDSCPVSAKMIKTTSATRLDSLGVPVEVSFQITFKVITEKTLFFSPYPTRGKYPSTTSIGDRLPSSYSYQVEKNNYKLKRKWNISDVDRFSMCDVAFGTRNGFLSSAGSSYVVSPGSETEFIFTLILHTTIRSGFYKVKIPHIVLYEDAGLKNPSQICAVEGIESEYEFILR